MQESGPEFSSPARTGMQGESGGPHVIPAWGAEAEDRWFLGLTESLDINCRPSQTHMHTCTHVCGHTHAHTQPFMDITYTYNLYVYMYVWKSASALQSFYFSNHEV